MQQSNNRRVVHVVSGFSGGGIGSVVMNYYSGISDAIVFDVIVNRKTDSVEEQEIILRGGRILEVFPLREGIIKYIKNIYTVLRLEKGSILHCHLGEKSFFFLLVAWLLGYRKRIMHVHSSVRPETKVERFERVVLTKICKLLATDYFACGEEAAKWFYGKDYGKTTILKNAIHINRFAFSEEYRQYYREKLFAENKIVVANVGRLSPPKNHSFLLSIFKELHNKDNNTLLVLVGAGELEEKIKNEITQLGIEDSVIMYGICNNVNELMNAFDIVIMPSISEGVPVAAIEALCNGLYVLCSDTITKEISIDNRIDYLPLSMDPAEWAERVHKSDLTRENVIPRLEEMGYSIEKQSSLLESFYLSA